MYLGYFTKLKKKIKNHQVCLETNEVKVVKWLLGGGATSTGVGKTLDSIHLVVAPRSLLASTLAFN